MGGVPMNANTISEWTLDGVLDELARIDKSMPDRHFAFILGAGASLSSRIPTGKELAERWLRDLHKRECLDGSSVEEWVTQPALGIANLSFDTAAEHYPSIFERRFRWDREAGYAELESEMEGKVPSLGYSLLAEIIQHTRHKVVVTTNFDNLVADALAMHAHRSPLVIAHESLAGFVRPRLRRPLVAKIHRDLFLNPKNDQAGVSTMEEGWTIALRKLFQYFTPIVVGYGGNDGSLMDFLHNLDEGGVVGRMVWCYREGSPPPTRARQVLAKHGGVQVKIPSFDHFMSRLAAKLVENFDVAAIAERTEALGKERAERYRKQAEELRKASEQGTEEQRRTGQVLSQSVQSGESWWAWVLRASVENDLAKRDGIYRQGLEHYPDSADLMCSYANFLADQRKDYDAAEVMYKKALELNPGDADITGNYALFLADQRKDYDAAEAMFKKALELNPSNANITGGYALFLANRRKGYDTAEAMYKKALELDPSNANITGNYANFLAYQRKDYQAAEAMYKKALELDPGNANNIANFASLLLSRATPDSISQVRPMVQQVVELSAPHSSQAVAEALLYGCLASEMTTGSAGAMLAKLKDVLKTGYRRGTWDFSPMFDRVLPAISPARQALYRALGTAIIDADRLAELDTFEAWRGIVPTDPFAPLDPE
jgi:tetratricopeptide (TPR) repeat protein